MEKSAEGIVGGATAEGPNDERQRIVTKRDGNASDHLRKQAAATPQDELAAGSSGQPESIHTQALYAQVVERGNLQRALKQERLALVDGDEHAVLLEDGHRKELS